MIAAAKDFSVVTDTADGRDITINVKDFGGAGPVALLHHANGFSAGTWELVARRLTRHFRVFAIDARGHGASDATGATADSDLSCFVADEIAVARKLSNLCGVPHIDLGIGSSFGGVVTAIAAARHDGLFRKIALLDPPIFGTPRLYQRINLEIPPEDQRLSAPVEQTRRRRVHFDSLDELRDRWRTRGMFAAWSDEAFEVYLSECLRSVDDGGVALMCDPGIEAHIYEATDNVDILDYVDAIDIPVLFARASKGLLAADYCERVAGLFRDCRYVEIDAGHLLPLEAPDAVVDRLISFAQR